MTPAQQAALEGLAGRELTPEEIAAIDPLVAHDVRNDVEVARILSTGRVKQGSVSKAQFAMWCGTTGMRAAVEDHAANAASPLRSSALTIKDFLVGTVASIDFGEPANVMMLNAWVSASAITQVQADDLIALGATPDPIHFNAVSDALNRAEGRMTL
jgi:hypothetical protein